MLVNSLRALARCLPAGTLVAILFAALALPSAASAAATKYVHDGTFGSTATFAKAERIAVHQATGLFFLVDRNGNRVRVYEPDENDLLVHVTDINAASRAGGNLTAPSLVAIDQVSGELYVAKTGAPAELIRFLPDNPTAPTQYVEDGTFTSPPGVNWGLLTILSTHDLRGGLAIARDASNAPVVFVADSAAGLVRSFDHDGAAKAVFAGGTTTFDCQACLGGPFESLTDLATGPDGSVYAADNNAGRVRLVRLAEAGGSYSFDREWDAGAQPATGANPLGSRVAVDQSTHEIFVANPARYVQFEGPDADQSFTFDFIFPARTLAGGLAIHGTPDPSAGGRLYLASHTLNITGSIISGTRVDIYGSDGLLAERPEIVEPITVAGITASSAAVSAQIIPKTEGTEWRAELRVCPESGCEEWPPAPPAGPMMQGPIETDDLTEPESVNWQLEDLEPNTRYEVRLVAVNAGGLDESSAVEFTTGLTAPDVTELRAVSVSAFRATLVGKVDPRNSDTLYFFELTDSDGETKTLPAQPEPLADDAGPSTVTADTVGLEPDSAYSFRLVAYLEADEDLRTESEPLEFSTRPAADSTFPGRGYELVSPRVANAASIEPFGISPDGERALWRSYVPLPDSENMGFDYRVSERGSSGDDWQAFPYKAGNPPAHDVYGLYAAPAPLLSDSLTHVAFGVTGDFDAQDQNHGGDVYLRDLRTGVMTWLSRGPSVPNLDQTNADRPVYVSSDGSQVIFGSIRKLLPSDLSNGETLYEWRGGQLRQVTLLPDSEEGPTQGSVLGSGQGANTTPLRGETRNAVSRDGERIAFTVTNSGWGSPALYVNDGGNVVEVDTGGAIYWGADIDMETVVYVKGGNLFSFDLDSEDSDMVHPAVSGGAGVANALHVSDDGNRIYFASTKDVLDDGHDTTPFGLWVAERPDRDSPFAIEFIGPVDPGLGWNFLTSHEYGADRDGDVLVFRSSTELVPGRKTGGVQQVYVYERAHATVYCLSCPMDGSSPGLFQGSLQASQSNSTGEPSSIREFAFNFDNPSPRFVAEDGTVAFQTGFPLVSEDADLGRDVYEWRGGEISLVSGGRGGGRDLLGGISEDGQTILFSSKADLVPNLPEAAIPRVYAARVGGGYVPPPPASPVCRGAQCRSLPQAPRLPGSHPASTRDASQRGSAAAARSCQRLALRHRRVRGQVRRQRAAVRKLRRLDASPRRITRLKRKTARANQKRVQVKRRLRACRGVAR